ncbi:MAG: tRNA (adenosine(37)-N6)-threonylcarbamoyltransferase complex transferase subunit TsaD [Elusimicrobia bacterium]|nr:tRNA (adenosine(37)-N6)-threonylcarbamoyltransferase complex transferase subunit TsaD [Elusimicrobiota bacterium]
MKRRATGRSRDPLVLGIETSCDETAAAVVAGGRVLSSVVSSQVALHRRFQGVVPELASRAHLQKIASVVRGALEGAGVDRVDAVAFARGPGLVGSLLVGKVAAQTLARVMRCPLIGVNHLEGHILAAELDGRVGVPPRPLRFPFVALVVSGGHTDLVCSEGPGVYRVLGRTRDDAAGEAFDKIARMLGLGYPGGPAIDRLAKSGDPAAIAFPRPLLPGSWDFSFSGLKTAVRYHLKRHGLPGKGAVADLCASLQEAVMDTLLQKTEAAARHVKARNIVVGGGVAANSVLREKFGSLAARGWNVWIPPMAMCTDNGVMIAHAAGRFLREAPRPALAAALKTAGGVSPRRFRPDPSLPLHSWGSHSPPPRRGE